MLVPVGSQLGRRESSPVVIILLWGGHGLHGRPLMLCDAVGGGVSSAFAGRVGGEAIGAKFLYFCCSVG